MKENQQAKESLKGDTLDFILQHTKDAPEHQLRDVDSLDTKMFQALSVATITLGLAGFAVQHAQKDFVMVDILLAAIMAYVAVAIGALAGLRIRRFRRSLQADVLWPQHWDRDVADVKHSLVTDIVAAYEHNMKILHRKAVVLAFVLGAMSFEAVLVGAVFVRALSGA